MLLSKTSSHNDISAHPTFTPLAEVCASLPSMKTMEESVPNEVVAFQEINVPDGNVATSIINTTTSAINHNYFLMQECPLQKESVYEWVIVGWAIMVLSLGVVTFGFPYKDVQDYDFNKAFITYIVMLIFELGIWIPMWTHMSPPKGYLKKRKHFLRASFVFFNHISNILEQIVPSISYLNHDRLFTFINLSFGVVSFLIISALFWLTIDLVKEGFKWEHLSLGCNAALSATLLNISVFQLIVKKSFLHFPLLGILRDVIELIDLVIKNVYINEEHC